MKKINYFLFAAASVLAAASCSHKELVPDVPEDPQIELQKMTFTASIEAETKTYLEDGRFVAWNEGDRISVFSNGSNYEFTATEFDAATGVATFEGEAAPASVYYSLYPYDALSTIDGNVISAEFPSAQSAVAESFDPLAALTVAKAENTTFHFVQAGSLLGFSLRNENIKSVTFSANESLCGKINVAVKDQAPEISVVEGVNEVTLSGNFQANTLYYVAVLPGTYTGIKVKLVDGDGSVGTLSNSNTLNVGRGQAVNIGAINVTKWVRSYTLNGFNEVKAFLDGRGEQREDVYNLTIMGGDVTRNQLSDIYLRVKSVNGTLTVDGACHDEWKSGDWNDAPHFMIERMDLKGNIVFRNILGIMKVTALNRDIYKVINGDFIVEDCPQFIMDWGATDGFANVEEVKGNLIIRNRPDGTREDSFANLVKVGGDLIIENAGKNHKFPKLTSVGGDFILKTQAGIKDDVISALVSVGGDFVLENITNWWYFGDDASLPLAYIGGDFVITECPSFWGFNGFQNLQTIGGNVRLVLRNDFPTAKDWFQSKWCLGLCTIRDFMVSGVISPAATVSVGKINGTVVDMNTIPTCDGSLPVGDLVISSKAQYEQIKSAGNKLRTKSLTISAADMSTGNIDDLANYISSIDGVLTFDGAASGSDSWWNPSALMAKTTNKGFVFKDLTMNIDIKGLKEYTRIGGDLVFDNCIRLYLRDGRMDTDLATITQIDGDLIIRGTFNDGWNRNGGFLNLQKVAGNIIIEDQPGVKPDLFKVLTSAGGVYISNIEDNISRGFLKPLETVTGDIDLSGVHGWLLLENLKSVGGDFKIHDCTQSIFTQGDADGVPALVSVGGDFVLKNLPDQYNKFNSLKTVGGDFILDGMPANTFNHGATKLMFDTIQTVGGNFELKNFADGSLYLRFAGLKTVGGDLTLDTVPSDMMKHTDTRQFMPALTSVSGSLTMQKLIGSMEDNLQIFKALKTVGGDFVVNTVPGVKRFHDGGDGTNCMKLQSIDGDLIITDNPAFKSLNGFQYLTKLGGNVTITGNSSDLGSQSTDAKNIGFCILKEYSNSGVMSPDAVVNIPKTWSTLATCENHF